MRMVIEAKLPWAMAGKTLSVRLAISKSLGTKQQVLVVLSTPTAQEQHSMLPQERSQISV